MNIVNILLGITLILWAITLLGIVAISSSVLGLFALITGIAYLLVGFGVHSGSINR